MVKKYSNFLSYYTKARDGLEVKEKDSEGMKRVLGLFELSAFGISAIIGGGIFVVTGVQARTNSGPAVMIAYIISGLIATLTALCYAEFASEVVITGGSFAYTTMMYGKFIGWVVGANIMLEYLLAGSTVVKGFSGYFTVLIGQPSGSLQFCVANCESVDWALIVDPIALAAVIILTFIMIFGVKESFWFNAFTVLLSVAAIMFCIFAGAPHVDTANFTQPDGFAPFGMQGIFAAASSVFFAYVGFDMIANGAEESVNPRRDVPFATAICLGLCTLMYAAASTVIVGLVPYNEIDLNAPFSVALAMYYPWAGYVVSLGACAGTFNSAFADLFAMSRLMVVQARCHLIPEFLARVNPKTGSPIVATIITGTITGILAFVVPLNTLADLVSMGTLFAFSLVDISVAIRARYIPGEGNSLLKAKLLLPSVLVVAGSCLVAFPYYYQLPWYILVAGLGVWAVGTVMFYTVPVVYRPVGFAVPLNPIMPCFGTLASIFLLGTLGPTTWIPWLGAMVVAMLIYAANGLYQYRTWWNNGIGYEEVDLNPDDARLPSLSGASRSPYSAHKLVDTTTPGVELDADIKDDEKLELVPKV